MEWFKSDTTPSIGDEGNETLTVHPHSFLSFVDFCTAASLQSDKGYDDVFTKALYQYGLRPYETVMDFNQVPVPLSYEKHSSARLISNLTTLKGRHGRPILVSLLPCWQKHVDKGGEALKTTIIGIVFMLLLAVFAEAVRYFREGLETSAVLVIARNKIDVKTKEVTSAVDCDGQEEDCARVVEEVVTPMKLRRCHWRHLVNTVLYGIQCGLQLQCLLGVLSLNIPLIASVLIGVLLGKLCFYWRPRPKLFAPSSFPRKM